MLCQPIIEQIKFEFDCLVGTFILTDKKTSQNLFKKLQLLS